MSDQFDPRELRNCLGQFATGVTIITTVDKAGAYVGLTANSFSSVSLDPPLVLWSLDKGANSLPVFEEAEHFAIHVLHKNQEEASNHFASKAEDKFEGREVEEGVGGIPLLKEYTARFQCKSFKSVDAGDHIIYIGEVVDFDNLGGAPLLFHAGRYGELVEQENYE